MFGLMEQLTYGDINTKRYYCESTASNQLQLRTVLLLMKLLKKLTGIMKSQRLQSKGDTVKAHLRERGTERNQKMKWSEILGYASRCP